MEDEVIRSIIIDNDTSYIKAGFDGEETPRAVFKNCVGYPKYSSPINEKDCYVGEEAEKNQLLN